MSDIEDRLHEAGRAWRSELDAPRTKLQVVRPAGHQERRTLSRLVPMAAAVAAVVLIAIGTSIWLSEGSSPPAQNAAAPPRVASTSGTTSALSALSSTSVSVQVVLDKSSVTAGTSIDGYLMVTNNTGATQSIESKCGVVDALVGLNGNGYTYSPALPLAECGPNGPIEIAPGVTKFPIMVDTTYGACVQDARSPMPSFPACSGPTPVPLSPGVYHTSVTLHGFPVGTQMPSSVDITVK